MIIAKVVEMIEKYNMVDYNDGIVVGLSGGPDSVCLLHALYTLKDKYNLSIYGAHLNHNIRGDEAQRDADFARDFAASLNIPFYIRSIKVEEYAKDNKLSCEEAGRVLRYELFEKVLREVRGNKIALAHNRNDQTETVIMRFLRGAGISGMGGIRPIRDNKYIRPILSCSRSEIEEYCELNKLSPVIDSTNSENIYTRNRIRLEVIPYIKKYFNPNIDENLFKVSSILRDEDEYLNIEANRELMQVRSESGIIISSFRGLHIAIKRRIIRVLIEEILGDLTGIESKHIEEVILFLENSSTGKSINLPRNTECKIEYAYFIISKKGQFEDFEYGIKIPGETILGENYRAITKTYEFDNKNLIDKQFVKYFDYDKIKDALCFRNRREGDYMYPKGMSGCKKLKAIFIDKKIPKAERQQIPLITYGNEILWILNMRDSKNYKLDSNSLNVLEIVIERGGTIG